MNDKNKINKTPAMNPPKTSANADVVVGIGASAGGLKAIQDFFDNIPGDTGLSFVVVQHLSPDYKSLMGELLAKHTPMQVFEAEDSMEVMPDCVYLIPSKKIIRIKNGRLLLEDKVKKSHPIMAIDIFFESLAIEKGAKAIGIIFSGTGSDGTNGIEAIKSKGGIVIVQDPISSEFDGMPNSAIKTGVADLILIPEMMGDELLEYIHEAPLIKSFNELNKKEELLLRDILELVHLHTSYDFSKYKMPTINRRLAKRMMEKNIKSIEDYYKFLSGNADEVRALSKEFLINVTKFFRDEEAFAILKDKVIPTLFLNKKANDLVKIWSVACSTGEEAYSLAMLVQEFMHTQKTYEYNVKIFATDIDQDALNVASKAIYSKEAVRDISQDRLSQFFTKEGDNYAIAPAIRKMVIFAKHDITKDPPFSKIELLLCRNMLIYMSPQLQKKVLEAFHFAVNEGGYLFLGPSENIGSLKECMHDIDKKWKIYKCITKSRVLANEAYLNPLTKDTLSVIGQSKTKNALNNLPEIFKETLLEEYKYAGIYIDKDMEVKQAIGNFKNFLNFPQGNFNFNLLKLVSPDLSVALGISVRKAIQSGETVISRQVKITDKKQIRFVSIIVKPYLQQKDYMQPFLFIILNEEAVKDNTRATLKIDRATDSEHVMALEKELTELRENLQAVIEEVESANEELQSSNEEIISANEELQSTNEELQSLNEELHTVNAEHQLKIKEMIELNDDLNNYFHNSQIGQVLIDKKLIIRKFSPAATRQINLIETDIGRQIADISTNFKELNFINEIKSVIKTNKPIEKEVTLTNDNCYLMRISPYVKEDKTTDGVVVNFIDISEIKGLNEIVKAVFNSSPNAIIALRSVRNSKGKITDFELIAANNRSAGIIGETSDEFIGKKLRDYDLHINDFFEDFVNVAEQNIPFHSEYKNAAGGYWYDLDAIQMNEGLVLTFTDTTQKKETAEELKSSNEKLEQTNYDLLQFASVASHDLKEPLRKIQVYGNMLNDRVENKIASSEKNYLDKIIGASNRMQILIDDVLTLSKLSNSEYSMEPLDLESILAKIIDDLDITIAEKDADISVADLPKINGVPGQMRQLFQNLITNSLKFSEGANPEIKITGRKLTKAEAVEFGIKGSDYVCIDVMDNGIGFDEKFSDKIFGLFQRLHGNIYQGTGIGLAICKRIVDNHKGFIKATGKPGAGAEFRIILPTAKKG